MAERIVCLIGFLLAFMGLLWGLFFRTFGVILAFVGLLIMLFGLFFMED